MTPAIGTDAAWLSFPAGEIFCLIIIAVSVFIRSKGITFKLEDWMKLDDDFGFSDNECLDLKVKSPEDVVSVSERVMAFCLDKNVDKKKAMYSGLCVEEMAGNIVEYGFKGRGKHTVDVRIVIIKDGMIIRIRDNTREFDPILRLEQYKGDKDVTKNIGIRIVSGLAEDMTYRSTAGVNNLLIKL
jgi:anti-sigma regulatory factor (Ser/Thr protein kinase)